MATQGSPPPRGVLFDLLMAVMDSPAVWTAAAGDEGAGWAWRDGVARQMIRAGAYVPYPALVEGEAASLGLPVDAPAALFGAWPGMALRPDAASLMRLPLPYGFVTNCSAALAAITGESAIRARLRPRFVLSAEEAGWYKPHRAIYLEACRRLGLRPGETFYVAGSQYDAEGARAAGLRVALVARRPPASVLSPGILQAGSLPDALAGIG